jgi:hypothetical protein
MGETIVAVISIILNSNKILLLNARRKLTTVPKIGRLWAEDWNLARVQQTALSERLRKRLGSL